MIHKIFITAFLCAVFGLIPPAYAADEAYTITVAVNSQDEGERSVAFHRALVQVVNAVSGNKSLASQLKVDKITDLFPYIKRFYYQNSVADDDDSDEDLSDDADESDYSDEDSQPAPASNPPAQNLVVEFDPMEIDSLIKSANAIAPSNLTQVLLWLSVDAGKKPWVLSNDDEDKFAQQVKSMGKNKNLDILLPMMDLDDMGAVTVSDITQFNVSALSQASMRYGSDLVLIAAVHLENKKWLTSWMLLKNGKRFTWDDQGVTLNGAILSGLLKASEMIITPSAVEINKEEHLVLTITGMENVTNYASINAYLQQLHEVSALQVLRVESTRVVFDVSLVSNSQANFIKSLQANPHLMIEPSASAQELNFKWKAH